jgi:uncharacterized membrane protein
MIRHHTRQSKHSPTEGVYLAAVAHGLWKPDPNAPWPNTKPKPQPRKKSDVLSREDRMKQTLAAIQEYPEGIDRQVLLKMLRCSQSTLQRASKDLKEKGLIEIRHETARTKIGGKTLIRYYPISEVAK